MHYFQRALLVSCFTFPLLFSGCQEDAGSDQSVKSDSASTLFTLLSPRQTNIDFSNDLQEGINTNILMYEYFYNGGGVATGDLNGDGLVDIYFTSNMGRNKVYLNKGKMQFQDITSISGAGGREGPWKTGITMADVNGDNKLDLYVCYSGMVRDENRVNELFINEGNDDKGIPRFREKAKEYGLASAAYSNQGYFFDYDRDGDLDAILLNHNPNSLPILNEVSTAALLKKDDALKGVRLFKQTGGRFEDVTKKSGISGSALTYGLGVGIADLNEDGWPDFYLSNDYNVPDYLYINNQDGTFSNRIQESLGHTSQFSMGNDVGDIDNDGRQDILTLDMLPEDNHRQKLLLAPDNYAKFELNLRTGFHYQYMRNMLQRNNGDGSFSEVGQLAGISNTDWSWAALLADYNNDGWKDLFITNGYFKDYTNLDFIKYMDDFVKVKGRLKREDVLELIGKMPSSNVVNFIFSNQEGLTFKNQTQAWGMHRPSNSNGAAYADLDNDGDLDIIVNNINLPAFVYQNESDKNPENRYLQIKLLGGEKNTQGVGAKIEISAAGKQQYLEQMPTRGYLSTVSPVLNIGLGKRSTIDSLTVKWLSGKQQVLLNVQANQLITLSEDSAFLVKRSPPPLRRPLFQEITSPIKHKAVVAIVNDFKRQPLLINQLSYTGPCLVKGDVNGDGLEDVYVGGGSGQPAALFIQQGSNKFVLKPSSAFEADKLSEDADAVFFDANIDGHQDLYVASGGYHQYDKEDALLQDRLYINDGKGNFTRSKNALPQMLFSKGCVAVNDINGDSFPDLFVGGRVIPGRYPELPTSYLLVNDGNGNFTDQIASLAPTLQKLGMITDAVFVDVNQDAQKDLIVVGEWMPVSIFVMKNNKLENETKSYFDKEYSGWWNKIEVGDFNNDQKPDLIVGNMGSNTQCKASDEEPAELVFKDFDNNGSVDPFLSFYIQGKSYPYVTRDELLEQIGGLRARFKNYKSYADITMKDIFKPDELASAGRLKSNHLETTLFVTGSDKKYSRMSLPIQAQYSPVHTISILDYNNDGNQDVLLCGNTTKTKLRLGKSDANFGVLLKGSGAGKFQYVDQNLSGFQLKGDVRSVIDINRTLIFGIGQKGLAAYKVGSIN